MFSRRYKATLLACAVASLQVTASASAIAFVAPDVARADAPATIAAAQKKAAAVAAALKKPSLANVETMSPSRRLTEAKLAFAMGEFGDVTESLLQIVTAPSAEAPSDTVLYYLAESLFRLEDSQSAGRYFQQLAEQFPSSAHRAAALERIVEIAAQTGGTADAMVAEMVAANTPNMGYVRGKYHFAKGDFAAAYLDFLNVPATSPLAFAARYYAATAKVAEKDYAKAVELFAVVANADARSPREKRVTEMAALAVARLYYETDVPVAAIDNYLRIHRDSNLFADALHEAAWVYVKNKQFDRALKALELLALADPRSEKLPIVRLLEGNLRIRKAQQTRARQVAGNPDQTTTPEAQYERAQALFQSVRDAYKPAFEELSALANSGRELGSIMPQVVAAKGGAQVSDISAAWLRKNPAMRRFVAIESDLGAISTELAETEAWVAKMEFLLASANKAGMFGNLASAQARLDEARNELIAVQTAIVENEATLAGPGATAGELAQTRVRKEAASQLAAVPALFVARDVAAKNEKDALTALEGELVLIEQTSQETRAQVEALRESPSAVARAGANVEASALDNEAAAWAAEITQLRNDLEAARTSPAGGGQDPYAEARARQAALVRALSEEHVALAAVVPTAKNVNNAIWFAQAERVHAELDVTARQIDAFAEEAAGSVRDAVASEKRELLAARHDFQSVLAEARVLGDDALRIAAKQVTQTFYEHVVGADVGLVDVAWSQKEDADAALKSDGLSRQREMRQLRDEFRDLLESTRKTPPSEPPSPASTPTPPADQPSTATAGESP